jgi:hypothetical protein
MPLRDAARPSAPRPAPSSMPTLVHSSRPPVLARPFEHASLSASTLCFPSTRLPLVSLFTPRPATTRSQPRLFELPPPHPTTASCPPLSSSMPPSTHTPDYDSKQPFLNMALSARLVTLYNVPHTPPPPLPRPISRATPSIPSLISHTELAPAPFPVLLATRAASQLGGGGGSAAAGGAQGGASSVALPAISTNHMSCPLPAPLTTSRLAPSPPPDRRSGDHDPPSSRCKPPLRVSGTRGTRAAETPP